MTSSPLPKPRRSSASAPLAFGSSVVEAPSRATESADGGSSPLPTSSDEQNAAPPKRVRIPGVEIARVGRFFPGGGDGDRRDEAGGVTFTPEDFADAVAAFNAGITPKPVLKVGHQDPRFDGEPSIGWVESLRVSEGGRVLVGDLAGVPRWVADAAPSHFPNRSLEAVLGYEDADGTVWPFVLTGLALLGATEPAIGNLKELRDFVAASSRGHSAVTVDRSPRLAAARARRVRRARNSN